LAVVDSQQRQRSPVEVVIEIRKEMEEFLRVSYPQTYRAEARAALRKALLLVAACSRLSPRQNSPETVDATVDTGFSPAPNSDGFSVIDHLRDRRVIHTWNKKQLARQRRILQARASQAESEASPSNSNQSADPVEITQPSSVPPSVPATSDRGA
jgi:hypothetical protein